MPCCGKVCFVIANEVFQSFYLLILRLFPGSFIMEEEYGIPFSILLIFVLFFANNTLSLCSSVFHRQVPVRVLFWVLHRLPLLQWITSKRRVGTSCQ